MIFMDNPIGDPLKNSTAPTEGIYRWGKFRFAISGETWIAICIGLLTMAAYLQVLRFSFIYFDDPLYITDNTTILGGLNWASIKYAFTTGDDGSYLPLVWLSHAASVTVFGKWAGGHHFINLLLHVANSVLLYYFLKRITKSSLPSASVALLFALHPLHVESVAWVAERKDVLSTLFWILTAWAYVRQVERPSLYRYLGMVLLFVLGMLSKSMLVTLPLTLLLLDVWPLRRIQWVDGWANRVITFWPLLREKVPLLAISAGAAAVTFFMQRTSGAVASLTMYPLPYRFGNALLTVVKYLEQTLWPWNLSVFYPSRTGGLPMWKVTASLAFVLAVSWGAIASLRKRPYLAVGWFWYLITLLPVVGIIQIGSQAHADRYTYVPLIGIFLAFSFLAEELIARWQLARRLVLVTAASLLAALFTLTVAQVHVWKDNLTVFKNAFTSDAQNPVALMEFGQEYASRGQWQDAYRVFSWASQLASNNPLSVLWAGYCQEQLGNDRKALEHYAYAKELAPDDLMVDQRLSQLLMKLQRFEEAAPLVKNVMQKGGSSVNANDVKEFRAAHVRWAVILMSRRRYTEAIEALNSELKVDPQSSAARGNLGIALSKVGRLEEALVQLEIALEMSPKDPEKLFRVGAVLTQLKRLDEARKIFDRMNQVAPESPLLRKGLQELERAQEGQAHS